MLALPLPGSMFLGRDFSLCFSFLICKMGIAIRLTPRMVEGPNEAACVEVLTLVASP